MKIKNFDQLAITDLRKKALEITEVGLQAIDTRKAIKDSVVSRDHIIAVNEHIYSLEDVDNVLVVGIGKSAFEAARALEDVLGDKIDGGIVLDIKGGELDRIESLVGDHPLPTDKNIEHTKKIVDLLKGTTERDLVIFIVSGGGSTLLCQPDKMTCQREADLAEDLFEKGASIYEINTIRKHLSLARGGNLAKYAYPAKVISLLFSDVPGDDLEFVASGPTYRDTTTIEEAEDVFKKYNLDSSGFNLIETPKEDKYFDKVSNTLLVSNNKAIKAMIKKAKELNYPVEYNPHLCYSCLSGEARVLGRQLSQAMANNKGPVVMIYGGETIVNITGKGRGGRNQELVLAALKDICQDCVIISIASDGRDNCNHAGAIGDDKTKQKAQQLGLDIDEYLKDNDSCGFFGQVKDQILTEITGSNVSDLIIAIKD